MDEANDQGLAMPTIMTDVSPGFFTLSLRLFKDIRLDHLEARIVNCKRKLEVNYIFFILNKGATITFYNFNFKVVVPSSPHILGGICNNYSCSFQMRRGLHMHAAVGNLLGVLYNKTSKIRLALQTFENVMNNKDDNGIENLNAMEHCAFMYEKLRRGDDAKKLRETIKEVTREFCMRSLTSLPKFACIFWHC